MRSINFKVVEVYEDRLSDKAHLRFYYKVGVFGRWKEKPIPDMPTGVRQDDVVNQDRARELIKKTMGELSYKHTGWNK